MSQQFSGQNQHEQSEQNQVVPMSAQNLDNGYYRIEVVTARTGLGVQMVQRCVSYGIITPQRAEANEELFSEIDLLRLRRVRRLVSELGLNWAGVDVVMRLTDELERLHQELNQLRPK